MFDIFYNFSGFNKELFLLINQNANVSIIPYLLQLLSWFFNISNFAVYYIIASLYCYKQICKDKDKFWPIYNEMVRIGIIYTTFGFTYAFLKFFINLPRPFCSLEPGSFITIANTGLERCLSSFPSSHTGLSIMITYILWENFTRWQRALAVTVVAMVALSRITLAMHYPADILYSIVVVGLVIIVGNFMFKSLKENLVRVVGKMIAQWFKIKI